MNHFEAADMIATEIPEVRKEIAAVMTRKNPFQLITIFTRHTRKMIDQHNMSMIDKCMKLMDRLYYKGDQLVRTAIENIFVYRLGSMVATCDTAERRNIMASIPGNLYSVYVRQFYRSGI
ncbi:DUF7674 family protein [Taibaiella helva]|uniref:DUF7674 family protein n=1 Tax=Taibaiella helva TaxID=2301235 RepID=UPI000E5714FF|nr:hypothetical protein [Taibaiella helva]